MAFITAQTGKNVKALINLSQSLFKQSQKRVSTGTLNRIVREAVEAHATRPHARTARRASITPPRSASLRPRSSCLSTAPSYSISTYQRYLLNTFREKLPFHDIPIKLYMRSRKQTEPGERSSSAGSRRRRPDRPESRQPAGRPARSTSQARTSRLRHALPQPRSQRVALGARELRGRSPRKGVGRRDCSAHITDANGDRR